MSRTRQELEERESAALAPYAMPSARTRGRDHPSRPDPHRTEFQRDRDRIIHSRAFRRLQAKTQVFTHDEGDHFRTRLTHTLEVVQLARAAARRLGLNEDLVECVALVHDVGHPPFGHRGEEQLGALMADHGGFEHNLQGLRIVEELEVRYPDHPGLNLTYEVRESIVKHAAHGDAATVPARFAPGEGALLEAVLVDEIDSIVYDCHDLDDGLRSGLLALERLHDVPLWEGAWRDSVAACPAGTADKLLVDATLRRLMERMLDDLVGHTETRLRERGIGSLAAVRACTEPVLGLAPVMLQAKKALENHLFTDLYRNPEVNRVFAEARRVVAELFAFFTAHPDALPPEHADRAAHSGAPRAVADYIAGMTDRFALEEHRRLC
jgi:dGTPase